MSIPTIIGLVPWVLFGVIAINHFAEKRGEERERERSIERENEALLNGIRHERERRREKRIAT
jgi:hypothetical protein